MQFTTRKRRHPPAIIIIALIDVLIVVLIFLVVTTTFRHHPMVSLVLPEARHHDQAGATDEALVVTVPKDGPIYLQQQPVTLEELEQRLIEAVQRNPDLHLYINADEETTLGQTIRITDAARAAKIRNVSTYTREGVRP